MTKLVGILNLTPDSFSGDGMHGRALPELLAAVDRMVEDGADVIDVGAQSTRPGAEVLGAEEEWQRLSPLVGALRDRVMQVVFSLDSIHPQNAARALDAGFRWVNDVSGGSTAMFDVLKPYPVARLVVMHSLTVPADKTITIAQDRDPVQVVGEWSGSVLRAAETRGIARERVILDPGIGFGKTARQSLEIIRRCGQLRQEAVELLIGHSRKSFLDLVTQGNHTLRDTATQAVSAFLTLRGVDYLRVHDVPTHRTLLDTLKVLQ